MFMFLVLSLNNLGQKVEIQWKGLKRRGDPTAKQAIKHLYSVLISTF